MLSLGPAWLRGDAGRMANTVQVGRRTSRHVHRREENTHNSTKLGLRPKGYGSDSSWQHSEYDSPFGNIDTKLTYVVFETELMGIKGVEKPETIKTISKTASSIASEATEAAADAASTAAEGILEKVAHAAATILADTDGDGQEHNEL